MILLHRPQQSGQCKGQRTKCIPAQHDFHPHRSDSLTTRLPLECRKPSKKSLTCSRWTQSFPLESCLQIKNETQWETRDSSPVVWIFPKRLQSLQESLLLATLRHTLYTGAERRAAPKLPEFCNWLRRNPTSLFVMWTAGLFVWLHCVMILHNMKVTLSNSVTLNTFALSFWLVICGI